MQPDGLPAAHPSCLPHKGDPSRGGGGGTRGLSQGQGPWETRNDVMCGEEPPAGAEGP